MDFILITVLWTAVENNTGQEPINILDPYLFKEFSADKENCRYNEFIFSFIGICKNI
jgi:hypothetical protein